MRFFLPLALAKLVSAAYVRRDPSFAARAYGPEDIWGNDNSSTWMASVTDPRAVNLGAVFDALINVNQEWIRDNRMTLSTDNSKVQVLVNAKGAGGADAKSTGNITVEAANFRSGVYSKSAMWPDIFAQAMTSAGWPSYDPNLKSIPVPDALAAVSGYKVLEYYNRAGGSSLAAKTFNTWLAQHTYNEADGAVKKKWISPKIPVIIQTVEQGASTLKPKYAYALQAVLGPDQIVLSDPVDPRKVNDKQYRYSVSAIVDDIAYVYTTKEEDKFAEYMRLKWGHQNDEFTGGG